MISEYCIPPPYFLVKQIFLEMRYPKAYSRNIIDILPFKVKH